MNNVQVVIPDLFLPQEAAAEACAGLDLPALEMMLARAQPEPLAPCSLETWLCDAFGVTCSAIAPVTLLADGMEPGSAWWLRADPVHVFIRHNEMLLQAGVPLSAEEASGLCASLNAHFSEAGLRFFSPHPQRWYVQLDSEPAIWALPLSQVAGKDVRTQLPQGEDALRWHRMLNEIQMLLYDHAVNQAREARGEPPINSVWLWGGGRMEKMLPRPFVSVCGDSELAGAFAQAAGVPYIPLSGDVRACLDGGGDTLIVWEGLQRAVLQGDLHVWRDSLLQFEQRCAAPLLGRLRAGRIARIALDVPGEAACRFTLDRNAAWKFWRRPKPLYQRVLR